MYPSKGPYVRNGYLKKIKNSVFDEFRVSD